MENFGLELKMFILLKSNVCQNFLNSPTKFTKTGQNIWNYPALISYSYI